MTPDDLHECFDCAQMLRLDEEHPWTDCRERMREQLRELKTPLSEAVRLVETIHREAAYMANKADTNRDREQFEHIRKWASRALAEVRTLGPNNRPSRSEHET